MPPPNFELRFPASKIESLSDLYAYPLDDKAITDMVDDIQGRGFLLKDDLFKVAEWKAPRNKTRVLRNSDEDVRQITGFALRTTSERARIESLRILYGVDWATASVILHFFHKERYPILDYRALWSLSVDEPNYYNVEFWLGYVECCRELADEAQVDMRTLDRALWQYSKANRQSVGKNGL